MNELLHRGRLELEDQPLVHFTNLLSEPGIRHFQEEILEAEGRAVLLIQPFASINTLEQADLGEGPFHEYMFEEYLLHFSRMHDFLVRTQEESTPIVIITESLAPSAEYQQRVELEIPHLQYQMSEYANLDAGSMFIVVTNLLRSYPAMPLGKLQSLFGIQKRDITKRGSMRNEGEELLYLLTGLRNQGLRRAALSGQHLQMDYLDIVLAQRGIYSRLRRRNRKMVNNPKLAFFFEPIEPIGCVNTTIEACILSGIKVKLSAATWPDRVRD